jgi:hypothetical protein
MAPDAQPMAPEPLPPPLVEPLPGEPMPGATTTTPTSTEPVVVVPERERQFALMVGGGVVNFTEDLIQESTDVGGYWDARFAWGTRQIIGVEAAYVGAAHNIDRLGLDPDASLVRNGLEGNLRVNIPIIDRDSALFEPFVFGGVGWSRYNLINEDFNTSDVTDGDDIVTVPLGLGLAAGGKGFIFDARFTYRPTFNDDLFDVDLLDTDDSLNQWSVGAMLGYEF